MFRSTTPNCFGARRPGTFSGTASPRACSTRRRPPSTGGFPTASWTPASMRSITTWSRDAAINAPWFMTARSRAPSSASPTASCWTRCRASRACWRQTACPRGSASSSICPWFRRPWLPCWHAPASARCTPWCLAVSRRM